MFIAFLSENVYPDWDVYVWVYVSALQHSIRLLIDITHLLGA